MPCFDPRSGWRSRTVNPSGKRSIVFNKSEGFSDLPQEVPCGQCIGCRLGRSRNWAVRVHHESKLYKTNSFLTLTYNPEHLPWDEGLRPEDFQKFMKRLRRKYAPRTIRYIHCGEYGEKNWRPHYHAILFNFDFDDKELHDITDAGEKLYKSAELERLWGKGFCTIGTVTFESAAYVARYITKKVNGRAAHAHYDDVDALTGEVLVERKPEYMTSSRNPAIGREWIEKYAHETFRDDFIIVEGRKVEVPRAYDAWLEKNQPELFARVKAQREVAGKKHSDNNTPKRLQTRRLVQERRFESLKRSYENET